MQFNPYQARATLVDPSASQGGINNLLQMQQNTLGGLTDIIGNIGKTSRTNTVNDLIARGGLEGLNEAQTQARIQQEAGGTLTPEGQAQVNQLLQTTGKNDQRQFTTAERLGGEKFTGAENETKAVAKLLSDQTKAIADKTELDRKYENDVKEFGVETALKNRVANETSKHNRASEGLTARGQDLTYKSQQENRNLQKLLGLEKSEGKNDPIKKLGLSEKAEQEFRGLAPDIRASLLTKDGKMLPNVGFVRIPEKRDNLGNVLRKESYRWENSDTGVPIQTSGFREQVPEEPWYKTIF